jgi:nitroreductase
MKNGLLAPVLVITGILLSGCVMSPTPPATGPEPAPSIPGEESKMSLPEPILTGQSVEICLNSRYSEHNPVGTASDQQLGNVLWAAGKAPVTGTYRNIYVATPDGTYLYDPASNSLSLYSEDVADRGAFVMSYDRELAFDAGVSYMPAILASVSLWGSGEPSVANCPMRSKLYFGVQDVRGLTPELVAYCSLPETDEGWLPDPKTTGDDAIETVLASLKYTDTFSQTDLTREQISQLLWAGYGCTPHEVAYNRKGVTVPSAIASYYLTGTIYMVNENGVYRYHNRNPDTDLTTRDHRLEQLKAGDMRDNLRSAVNGLSQAPCYIVLCLKSSAAGQEYAQLEAGFVAGNMLMQATALDLGCYFKTKLTSAEQQAIQNACGIPSSHVPQAIVSLGKPQI